MADQNDQEHIMREYAKRRRRQLWAAAAAIVLMILCAAMSVRSDLLGWISKSTSLKLQALIVLAFINFTAFNWRCPSCGKYLGSDLGRRICAKCKARLL